MRTISYAALALVAGLAMTGVARADEYISASNQENYAVSAASAATEQALLPLTANATARLATTHRPAQAVNPATQIVGPFSNGDAHSGPSHNGSPALW